MSPEIFTVEYSVQGRYTLPANTTEHAGRLIRERIQQEHPHAPGLRIESITRVRPVSRDLKPGTKLRHTHTGAIAVLGWRKVSGVYRDGSPQSPMGTFLPGWWCEDIGGLADCVIDGERSSWKVVG